MLVAQNHSLCTCSLPVRLVVCRMSKRARSVTALQEHQTSELTGLGYRTTAMSESPYAFTPLGAPLNADHVPYSPSSPAYRPTSPSYLPASDTHEEWPASPQYTPSTSSLPTSCSFDMFPLRHRRDSICKLHPDYAQMLQRIESNDPALTHVHLMPIVNNLFGHPEWEYSGEPAFSDAEVMALGRALSKNTCITSLDLSRLALGSQAVSLMGSLTHLSALSVLNFKENFMPAGDIAHVFHQAAAAGMTQLQQLLICEPSHLVQHVPVIAVVRSTSIASSTFFL